MGPDSAFISAVSSPWPGPCIRVRLRVNHSLTVRVSDSNQRSLLQLRRVTESVSERVCLSTVECRGTKEIGKMGSTDSDAIALLTTILTCHQLTRRELGT